MKKTIILLAAVLIILSFGSCSLLSSSYVIRIENKSDSPVDAYYKTSVDTEWLQLSLGILIDGVKYVEIDEGTFDFRAVFSGSTGPDSLIIGTEENFPVDYQYNWTDESEPYDYNFDIYSSFVSVL